MAQHQETEPLKPETSTGRWADEAPKYKCLVPAGSGLSADVKEALARLTGVEGVLPAPHPVVLVQDDLWKLSHYKYMCTMRGPGLRMLMCLLQVNGRTVAAFVSENMMVVRGMLGKLPFALFKGSVFTGYMVTGDDGSAEFTLFDCLYYKGKNMSKQMFEARQEMLMECHAAYHAAAVDCGFSLSFAPYWEATEERFWQLADEQDNWRSILFVPAGRGLKLGSVQSTLFELSSVDFATASDALTEAVISAPSTGAAFAHAHAHFAPIPQPPPLPPTSEDNGVGEVSERDSEASAQSASTNAMDQSQRADSSKHDGVL